MQHTQNHWRIPVMFCQTIKNLYSHLMQRHFVHSPPPRHNQPHISTIHSGYDSGILKTTPPFRQISPHTPNRTHNRLPPTGSTRRLVSHICNRILLLPCQGRQRMSYLPINFHHRRTNKTQTLLLMPPPTPSTPPIIQYPIQPSH